MLKRLVYIFFPDQDWTIYVYDLDGEWINFWTPTNSFLPVGMSEVSSSHIFLFICLRPICACMVGLTTCLSVAEYRPKVHTLIPPAREVGSPVNPLSARADRTDQPFSPFKVDYSFPWSLQPAKLHVLLFLIDTNKHLKHVPKR